MVDYVYVPEVHSSPLQQKVRKNYSKAENLYELLIDLLSFVTGNLWYFQRLAALKKTNNLEIYYVAFHKTRAVYVFSIDLKVIPNQFHL